MQLPRLLVCAILFAGCDVPALRTFRPDSSSTDSPTGTVAEVFGDTKSSGENSLQGKTLEQSERPRPAIATDDNTRHTLVEVKAVFRTTLVRAGDAASPPDDPRGGPYVLVDYPSKVGDLAAYVTKDPGDGQKKPAILWITGGDCNSIGDVWSEVDRSNDQGVNAFQKAGIVVMFPSLRGGNDNPGRREGFFGEVDDILAATDYLSELPYVDSNQIYLGGHSTGGTMVLMVAASTNRYKAIISLGPVAAAKQYGGDFVYCDSNDDREMELRSPIYWLHCIESPTFVLEGAEQGNWDGSISVMSDRNNNPLVSFHSVPRFDHFSLIGPLAEKLAPQILNGQVEINATMLRSLR